jgi:hypothetical protein
LILAWKMTTRALVSALRHLPPGESDSATAASEPMCSKSSDFIIRGGTGDLPVGVVSSTSSSSASIPRPNFSAPIIRTDPPTAMRSPKLPSSPSPYLFCKKRRDSVPNRRSNLSLALLASGLPPPRGYEAKEIGTRRGRHSTEEAAWVLRGGARAWISSRPTCQNGTESWPCSRRASWAPVGFRSYPRARAGAFFFYLVLFLFRSTTESERIKVHLQPFLYFSLHIFLSMLL